MHCERQKTQTFRRDDRPRKRVNIFQVVNVDVVELVDRIFCPCGLDSVFQEAFTLTALDPRNFAPPIESPQDRLVNVVNACETFHVSPQTVAYLLAVGFKSVSLLSLSSPKGLKLDAGQHHCLEKCVRALNDTCYASLEPLHSLRRLLHHYKRPRPKQDLSQSASAYLDLAVPSRHKRRVASPNEPFKANAQPIIARSTLRPCLESRAAFGRQNRCRCLGSRVQSEVTNLSVWPSPSSPSSSGFSSGSDESIVDKAATSATTTFSPADLPRNPAPLGIEAGSFPANPVAVGPPNLMSLMIPNGGSDNVNSVPLYVTAPTNRIDFGSGPTTPTPSYIFCANSCNGCPWTTTSDNSNSKCGHERICLYVQAVCPCLGCPRSLLLKDVDNHLAGEHGIRTRNSAVIKKTFPNNCGYQMYGEIALTLDVKRFFDEDTRGYLFWGPKPFMFNSTMFYLVVYKTYHDPSNENILLFWIWTGQSFRSSRGYRYEIHLECARSPKVYSGVVQSLETPFSALLECKVHELVFYRQSYLKKVFYSQQCHGQTDNYRRQNATDIKYTAKLMKLSL